MEVKILILFSLLLFPYAFCIEYRAFPKINSVSDMFEYQTKPKIIKRVDELSTDYRASDDFISGISFHYEMNFSNKNDLLSTLEVMLSHDENSAIQAEMFRQIEQTNLLSREEKIAWLKSRIDKIPAPFTMLLAKLIASDNLEEAFTWKTVSQIRMKVDEFKCKDKTVYSGIELIEFYFLDTLFDLMVVTRYQEGEYSQDFLHGEYDKLTRKGIPLAIKYHDEHTYQVKYPYWLTNHGMAHLTHLMNGLSPTKEELFVSTTEWKKAEADFIKLLRDQL